MVRPFLIRVKCIIPLQSTLDTASGGTYLFLRSRPIAVNGQSRSLGRGSRGRIGGDGAAHVRRARHELEATRLQREAELANYADRTRQLQRQVAATPRATAGSP